MLDECNHLSYERFLWCFVAKISLFVHFQVVFTNKDFRLSQDESVEKYQYFPEIMLRASTARGPCSHRENGNWFLVQGAGLNSGDPIEKVLECAGDRVIVLWWSNYNSICFQYLLVKRLNWVRDASCLNIPVVNGEISVVEDLEFNVFGLECLPCNLKSSEIGRFRSQRTTDSNNFVCCACFNHM